MIPLHIPIWRRGLSLVAVVLIWVILADVLFYGHFVGWTAGAFLLAVMTGVAIRQGYVASSRPTWILVVLLLGLAVAMVIAPGPIAILFATVAVGVWALSERVGWTHSLRTWWHRLAFSLLAGWAQPICDGQTRLRWQRRCGKRHTFLWMLLGWLVPVLLTGVFLMLFRTANPIIGNWIETLGEWLSEVMSRLDDMFVLNRLLLWMGVGVGGWALLRHRPAVRRRAKVGPSPSVGQARTIDRFVTVKLVVRCLVMFNLLFAVQTAMDVYYLWGGGALPEGMTYATYAHRGAYPLVATALLAGVFVLIGFRPGGAAEQSAMARRLVYLWIGQNIFLVVSAAWRLQLYVDVYSLTRWRVAAAIWMLLVALGLGWVVWRIVRGYDNSWLLRVNVLTVAAVLYGCTFVDFDGRIAWFNVQRCAEVTGTGVPIDAGYLEHLGVETLPAVAWLRQRLAGQPEASARARHLASVQHRLTMRLHREVGNWRGWTLQRHRLAVRFLGW